MGQGLGWRAAPWCTGKAPAPAPRLRRSPGPAQTWLPVQPALDQQRPPAHGPSPHGPGAKHSQQSVEVLQFPGRPPAWEHWRENSATVLQTQVDPGAHWHWSCTQACTYSSRGTRPRQPSKALAVSSLSHSARCGRHGRWVGTARPPPSTGPRGSASRHRAVGGRGPQPLTHVLCAGRGGWHLLGVVAYHLGLVDLLHAPKLQGTEEHAWRAQPISGGAPGPAHPHPPGPRGGPHHRRGTRSRSAGRCSPHRGHTCGSGTYCPVPAVGKSGGWSVDHVGQDNSAEAAWVNPTARWPQHLVCVGVSIQEGCGQPGHGLALEITETRTVSPPARP